MAGAVRDGIRHLRAGCAAPALRRAPPPRTPRRARRRVAPVGVAGHDEGGLANAAAPGASASRETGGRAGPLVLVRSGDLVSSVDTLAITRRSSARSTERDSAPFRASMYSPREAPGSVSSPTSPATGPLVAAEIGAPRPRRSQRHSRRWTARARNWVDSRGLSITCYPTVLCEGPV